MDKIFNEAKDKNVAKVIIYTGKKVMTSAAYTDRDCTNEFTPDQLEDAFFKGCVVCIPAKASDSTDEYYYPLDMQTYPRGGVSITYDTDYAMTGDNIIPTFYSVIVGDV